MSRQHDPEPSCADSLTLPCICILAMRLNVGPGLAPTAPMIRWNHPAQRRRSGKSTTLRNESRRGGCNGEEQAMFGGPAKLLRRGAGRGTRATARGLLG